MKSYFCFTLLGMVIALVLDKMRPGMAAHFFGGGLFLYPGILTPKEMLKDLTMITVAMLFLVSEGIRQSGALAASRSSCTR